MNDAINIAKALSDGNRARVLMFLRRGELCVCQIMEILGLAPSTVSTHLNVLHRAGLVESRKQGRWIYYRLPGRDAAPHVRGAVRWLHDALADDPQIKQDERKLRAVCKMPLGDLCCRYKREGTIWHANSKCCSCAPATPAAARWPKVGHAHSRTTSSSLIPPASRPTG
jgi:DNA-binding transcriptional ArsR family regulator